jgi:alanine racemase
MKFPAKFPTPAPCAQIDAAALRNNLAVVRRLAPRSRVLAAVKANAYGHGLLPTARALAAADAFGVARLEEAVQLREAGIDKPLLLLEGAFSAEQLESAARHQLDVVVHSFEQLSMLEAWRGAWRFSVWLKLDTGMNRVGFKPQDFAAAQARLARCAAVGQLRLMTHLAAAEDVEGSVTRQQIDTFVTLTSSCALERSVANSAGVIGWPEAHLDWVRPGIMLYGISSLAQTTAAELGLVPAMTLSTRLIAVRDVAAGETVGYNGIWRAPRPSRIGVAAIGYGDGYPRVVSSGTPVLVNGRAVPIVGRVSMDMMTVDVTDLGEVAVGDEVTLWGRGLPVERIARCANTIGYELVCRVTGRVAVEWVEG